MSDTSKVWIALDREVAEAFGEDPWIGHPPERWEIRRQHLIEACRKSLVTECFEVGGEDARVFRMGGSKFVFANLPAAAKEGPATLIVIAGERDG
jgi:hypothetical protein